MTLDKKTKMDPDGKPDDELKLELVPEDETLKKSFRRDDNRGNSIAGVKGNGAKNPWSGFYDRRRKPR